MKTNVLTYGSIIGVILCINMVLLVNVVYQNPDVKGNELIGYAAMVVMFSLIFFGVRNYRNKQADGFITFGKAFKIGALIALVAATMYVTVWLFYYYLFVPDFIDAYTKRVLQTCSPSELEAKAKEMANFKEMYKNPLFVLLITYSEVLPVGLVVALVSALILARKNRVALSQ
jgi:amino acid transporter